MSFTELGLSDALLRAIDDQGYTTPTEIQELAIPAVLAGRDMLAAAQTGTGKTAGFTLPLLQLLSQQKLGAKDPIKALVLTPTRELAAQVAASVAAYGEHLPLRSAVVFGGVNIKPQIRQLRAGVDILVATPGRLLDLHGQGIADLSQVQILVLDEADRMLDMGFINDIKKIISLMPKKRQNLLFSATFSGEIRRMAQTLLDDPVRIDVTPKYTAAETVEQKVHPVDPNKKPKLLSQLILDGEWEQVLIFTRTKRGANQLTQKLVKAGISTAVIHGNKSQGARTRALADFKGRHIRALVATDIAARGLDIEQLPYVVNYELPEIAEDYVHRIGRTGRAGALGKAISLVSREEEKQLKAIERILKKELPSEVVEGFEPDPDRVLKPKVQRGSRQRSQNRRPQSPAKRGASSGARGNARPAKKRSPRRSSTPAA